MPVLSRWSDKEVVGGECFVLNKENEAIIRSLILSRGREGCTLKQIKADCLEHEGVILNHPEGDAELYKMISKIDYVKSFTRTGSRGSDVYFYSESPDQQHLVNLIRHQRPRVFRRSSPTKIIETKKNPSPKGSAKKKQKKDVSFDSTAQTNISSSSPKACLGNESLKSQKSIKDELMSNVSATTTTTHGDEMIIPKLHGCPLIGDNFFYNMATLDLGFPNQKSKEGGRSHCNTCMNGMTIRMAREKVEQEIEAGSIIITNIGSSDILNERQLIELLEDMIHFLTVCELKQVIPILTTLAPLPSFATGNRRNILTSFNDFLKANPYNYPVIDIYQVFVNTNNKVDLHAFQPEPRKFEATKNRILMWNKVGRRRTLSKLKEEMGFIIVNIFALYSRERQQVKVNNWQ